MSKILQIVTHPNKILRKISEEIDVLKPKNTLKTKEFSDLLTDMTETMIKKDGVGLAAPQIGKNIRVIVVVIDNKIITMINPKITKRSWSKEAREEGCLSVPKTYGKVKRHKQINCTYIDKNGKNKKLKLEKMNARVIQHEIDHLDGILFIDKAKNIIKE